MHEQGAKRGFLSLVAELLSFELYFGFSSFSSPPKQIRHAFSSIYASNCFILSLS